MTMLEKFREKVFETTDSFDIVESGRNYPISMYYHFMQDRIGSARYIYAYNSTEDDSYLSVETKYTLLAIVSDYDQIIYLVDTFFFISQRRDMIPDGIVYFNEFVENLNTEAINTLFPKFIDSLDVTSIDSLDEDRTYQCIQKARGAILDGKNSYEIKKPKKLIGKDDAAKILCRLDTLEGIVTKKLAVHQKEWTYDKAEVLKINELIQNKFDVVTPCEFAIAQSLQKVGDAKSVTVEFTVDGKTAAEKMAPETITSRMIYERNFDDYDFVTAKGGKELMKKLNIGFSFGRVLAAEDISKITYGKKVLYHKEMMAA